MLLLEAGGRGLHPNIAIPAAFAKQFHTRLDWDYSTEPEPHCDGRSLYLPRGKGLGGSSGMNAMLYVRGRPLDYDLWDVPGWRWDDVRPYFLKAEDNARGASEHHATGGPLRVEDERSPRPLTKRFLAAAEADGIRYIDDYNGPEQDGAALCQVTQRNGKRWSTNDAYLRPVRDRGNLQVVTGATVSRVRIQGGRATGVVCQGRFGREHVLEAAPRGDPRRRRLRLPAAADAVRASGPPSSCARSGSPSRSTRPRSARTSRTIRSTPSSARSRPTRSADAEHPRYLAEWLLRRSGPLTSTVAEAFAFVRTRPGLPAPDVQYHFAPAYFVDHGAEEFDGHALTLGPVLITPKSRGRLWLRSADPSDKPRILTNSLAEPEDVAAMLEGMKIARELIAQEPLRSVVKREIFPGPAGGGPRGRPAPPRRAALPPGRHLPHGHRRRLRRRRRAARARRRRPARGRRLDHAADHGRQHERAVRS